MQCLTHPFTNSSGFVFAMRTHLFSLAPFVVNCAFLIDIFLLCPWYAHLAAAATSTCWFLAPFVPLHPVYFYCFSFACVLVSLLIHATSVVASFSWPLVPGQLTRDGSRGATAFRLALNVCCTHTVIWLEAVCGAPLTSDDPLFEGSPRLTSHEGILDEYL